MSNVHKQHDYYTHSSAYVIVEEDIAVAESDMEIEPSPVKMDISMHLAEAKKIITDAEKKAQQIIDSAEKEASTIRKKAAEEGMTEGIGQGRQKGYDEYKALISDATDILRQMHEKKFETINSMEKEMLKLSITVAEKIIGQAITEDSSVFSSIISKGLKRAAGSEKISIYISPQQYLQYESIDELKAELKRRVNIIKSFDIIKEELADSLDCLVITEFEEIDVGVKSQIKQIQKSLNLTETFV